jgi:LCP family protein required for cell wall assembly
VDIGRRDGILAPVHTRAGGHRAQRVRLRRARTVRGALGVTLLGIVLPGSGILWTGRLIGYLLMVPAVGGAVYLLGSLRDVRGLVELAADPERLRDASVVLGVGLGVWMVSVLATYFWARPAGARTAHAATGAAVVVLACLAAALPVVHTMRIASAQADLVETLFTENRTATAPRGISEEDPWGGREHVSILLLGGDGSVTREGVRTDSVMLLVLNTRTGRSVMFSLPRNMMYAQFPLDSPLHGLFPDGYTTDGDPSAGMLNAIYGQLPARYPGVLGDSDNEGADALKQAVAGSLGVDVDYYVLVNLLGFQQVVDAMGGVTVNVNEPVAINGDTDRGIPPTGYIEPGPDQHLDGFHALWFSRGRWGSDDYERMLRQRCMVGALIDAADPVTLVRRYLDLAEAGKEIVRTDIPRSVLPALVNLGLRVKDHRVRSIAFVSSERFFSGDPDYTWMHESVQRAMEALDGRRRPPPGGPATDPGEAVDVKNSCAYHPVT